MRNFLRRISAAALCVLTLAATALFSHGAAATEAAQAPFAEPAPELNLPRSEAALSMMNYLESDPELMALMEQSIAAAAKINPDPATNPVRSVDELYDFIDWAVTCMPWNVLTDASYPTLYGHIDQGVCYFWFLIDQPLPALEGKGYYYPTLQYHEPIATWCKEY